MKNKLSLLAVLFLSGIGFSAPLKVATTLPPYRTIVADLAGERAEVHGLVPAGVNYHVWEPTPATIKALAGCSILFTDSMGMDLPWLPRFQAVNPNLRMVAMATDVAWMEQSEHEEHEEHHEDHDGHAAEEEHHHHEGLDPHIWTSPKQVMSMAVRISAALMAADPQGMPYYKKRLADFLTRAHQLDQLLKRTVAKMPANSRRFIVYHPSYGYLARDYGLIQESIEFDGKEPKPATLAHLVETAKAEKIRLIFVQPEFNQRSARTLAQEIGGSVLPTDPTGTDWEGNLRSFAQALETASRPTSK